MLMFIQSHNWLLAKEMDALVRPGLQPSSKGEEENFGFVMAKPLTQVRQRL